MKFTLLTPAQQVAEMEATYVNVPGEKGDFGVLPGHMPLISTLRGEGIVEVTDTAGTKHTYTVSGGFADVGDKGVTILAESIG